MPLYEFVCPQCEETFEELVRNLEAAKDVVCPNCGNHKVKRKLSTFSSKIAGGSAASNSGANCAPSGL